MNRTLEFLYLAAFVLISLSACSSGNVHFPDVTINGPQIQPPPPTSEAITAYGVITSLDDLSVNDVRYASSTATVTVNGQPGTLADLRRGQIVTVRGTINGFGLSGTAQSIEFDASLIGPVQNLDATSGRLTVLGQPVITGSDTLFAAGIDPATLSGLSVGTIVQVSGFTDAAGAIHATRIDPDATSTELQLVTTVAGLDLANLLFTVNGLTADYSGAVLIDLPGGAPSNGMTVKANGRLSAGLFVVERLVLAPGPSGSTGQRVQTAGRITRFGSSADFDLNGVAAAVDAATAFNNGNAGDLSIDTEIVIDGDLAANGRIVANRITFGDFLSRTATVVFDLRDFTEISVPSVFNVTVTQGADYSVEVVVDEDVASDVDVTQTGSRLSIAMLPGNHHIHMLHAYVTMPALDRIDLSSVVNARLNDFSQAQMTVNVSGVSRLHGNGLTIANLTANVSGVSHLNFADVRPIGTANVTVSGVSQATLNMDVNSTLTGSVATGQGTGISALFYYGTNVNLTLATDSTSSVVKLGETRG